jgi:addiction module HigA family antidote
LAAAPAANDGGSKLDYRMGQLRNPHPGEILKEEFLNEIGVSQNRLAQAIGVPGNRIHAIVNGTRDVTADTDRRLCKFFGLSEGYFLKRFRHARSKAPDRRRRRKDQTLQAGQGGLAGPATSQNLQDSSHRSAERICS